MGELTIYDTRVPLTFGKVDENTVNEIHCLIEQCLPALPAHRKNRKNGGQMRADVILKALRHYTNRSR